MIEFKINTDDYISRIRETFKDEDILITGESEMIEILNTFAKDVKKEYDRLLEVQIRETRQMELALENTKKDMDRLKDRTLNYFLEERNNND